VLARSNRWFLDGTFSVSPHLFRQLFVVRAILDAKAVTCVYAFLSGKSQVVYEKLFRIIQQAIAPFSDNIISRHVTVDFELSVIGAIRKVFGNAATIKCCF
jgi:hypothetical protein